MLYFTLNIKMKCSASLYGITSFPGMWSRTGTWGSSSEEKPQLQEHLQNLKMESSYQSVFFMYFSLWSRNVFVDTSRWATSGSTQIPLRLVTLTGRLIKNIRSQNDVHIWEQDQVWGDLAPRETQHLHILQIVGFTAASAVLQALGNLGTIWQDHVRTTACRQHARKTHACAHLRRDHGTIHELLLNNSDLRPRSKMIFSPPAQFCVAAPLYRSTGTEPAPLHRATRTCHTVGPEAERVEWEYL